MKSTDLAAVPLTMSTLEIAGLTGKAHKHVLADTRRMLATLQIQPAEFSARYLDAKGEAREVMSLPKRECLILVSGYSVEMRARIVDRWLALEAALAAPPALPSSSAEEIERTFGIVRMLARKITAQENEIRDLRAMIEINPHRAVPYFITPLDLAIEQGARQRGRRNLCLTLGNRMVKRARELGVEHVVVRTISRRRMFEQKFARTYMREAGVAVVSAHNRAVDSEDRGQTVLPFRAVK